MNPRVRLLNNAEVRRGARYVLYWAQMNRRADANHALEHAATEANRLALPLVVCESLGCAYPYANDRLHTFILEGVPENARRFRARGAGYVFGLRKRLSEPGGLLGRLAAEAALLVTDDYPVSGAAANNRRLPARLDLPYVVVDSSCIVPMALHAKKEYGAYTIRPKIHKQLNEWLRPVERVELDRRWKGAPPCAESHTEVMAEDVPRLVAECEIDHTVKPSLSYPGGRVAAERHLAHFLKHNLARYGALRNEPAAHATSNLSPWLHFGHISALEVALAAQLHAAENGFSAAEFLEELIVRRELAFNHARFAARPEALEELPRWARETLSKHDGDRRQWTYSRAEFERAETHDALWNATQREMLLRGKIHGYYRMYWGKKIIEWSASHQEALETMVYLHDRYALDGRDPNTYTNILWCFGLHDRPWQERPVFGQIRYMGLEGMKRKTGVDAYLREIAWLNQTGEDPVRLK